MSIAQDFLEVSVNCGLIPAEMADEIYERNFESFEKNASWIKDIGRMSLDALKSFGYGMLPYAMATVAAGGVGALGNIGFKKLTEKQRDADKMKALKSVLLIEPSLASDPQKTINQFNEITKIAPSMQMFPQPMASLIKKTTESGLTIKDMETLTAIQSKLPKPETAAGAFFNRVMQYGKAGPQIMSTGIGLKTQLDMGTTSRETMSAAQATINSAQQAVDHMRSLNAETNNALDRLERKGHHASLTEKFMNMIKGHKKQASLEDPEVEEFLGNLFAAQYETFQLNKQASFANMGRGILETLSKPYAPVLIAAAGALGLGLAGELKNVLQRSYQKKQQENAFAKIVKEHPLIGADPLKAREVFNVLADYAPSMAEKPIVAGTFVKKIMQSDSQIDPHTVGDIAKTELEHARLSTQTRPFMESVLTPFQALGGAKSIGSYADTKSRESQERLKNVLRMRSEHIKSRPNG